MLDSVRNKAPNPARDAEIDRLMAKKKAMEAPAAKMSGLAVKEKELRGNDQINEPDDFANTDEEAWFNPETNKLETKFVNGTAVKHYAGDRSTEGVTNLKPITTPEEARQAYKDRKMFVTVEEGSNAVQIGRAHV